MTTSYRFSLCQLSLRHTEMYFNIDIDSLEMHWCHLDLEFETLCRMPKDILATK